MLMSSIKLPEQVCLEEEEGGDKKWPMILLMSYSKSGRRPLKLGYPRLEYVLCTVYWCRRWLACADMDNNWWYGGDAELHAVDSCPSHGRSHSRRLHRLHCRFHRLRLQTTVGCDCHKVLYQNITLYLTLRGLTGQPVIRELSGLVRAKTLPWSS